MFRKLFVTLVASVFLAVAAVGASAQDVIMNSAETINWGNFKLAVFPTVLFAQDGGDSLWGVAGRFGIGLTPRFDIEAKGAIFKGIRYFGADAEVWLVRGPVVNFSLAVGGHMADLTGGPDYAGIDTYFLISTLPVARLEFYGGLKFAFDWIRHTDQSLTRAHFVPGIEYRISQDLDFLVEVGIALNNNARSYASIGFALYIR